MTTAFQAAFEAATKPIEKNREEQVTPKVPVLNNIPRRPVLPQKKKPASKNPDDGGSTEGDRGR